MSELKQQSPKIIASASCAQAMVLAAGRGNRMRPLTDTTPKPLLTVRGKPLIQWHLEELAKAGVTRVLINTGWLGEKIVEYFGTSFDAEQATIQLTYSREDLDFGGGIETAGAIARALPLLEDSFWLVAGDIFAPNFPFNEAFRQSFSIGDSLAHLWLVDNPVHHPEGDFCLHSNGLVSPREQKNAVRDLAQDRASNQNSQRSYTYSAIALLRKQLFAAPWCSLPSGNPEGIEARLAPVLFRAAAAKQIKASVYHGSWTDVGTPERLAELNMI